VTDGVGGGAGGDAELGEDAGDMVTRGVAAHAEGAGMACIACFGSPQCNGSHGGRHHQIEAGWRRLQGGGHSLGMLVCPFPYCKQVPVLGSQVDPAEQHAWQVPAAPTHWVVPAGQAATAVHVGLVGSSKRPPPVGEQVHTSGLPGLVAQQVPTMLQTLPLLQVQTPFMQVALTVQRLPQEPQLRGSVIRLTHVPPQLTVPGGLATHWLRLQRFLPFLLLRHLPRAQRSHRPHAGLHVRLRFFAAELLPDARARVPLTSAATSPRRAEREARARMISSNRRSSMR
jgi:hypothetical protein